MEIGDPGDENRNQDEVVDQDLRDQDVKNDDPPELPADTKVLIESPRLIYRKE